MGGGGGVKDKPVLKPGEPRHTQLLHPRHNPSHHRIPVHLHLPVAAPRAHQRRGHLRIRRGGRREKATRRACTVVYGTPRAVEGMTPYGVGLTHLIEPVAREHRGLAQVFG